MSIPYPKILTSIEVPTGGWTVKVYYNVGDPSEGSTTATIPAGTYYMAWDQQSDDFLYQFCKLVGAAFNSAGFATLSNPLMGWLDTNNKVNLQFRGPDFGTPADMVKFAWTEEDGASIGLVLGFDTSADDTFDTEDGPLTADYQHAYAWYADGPYLKQDHVENAETIGAGQAVALNGYAATHYYGSRYTAMLSLHYVPRVKMFSGRSGLLDPGQAYGSTLVYTQSKAYEINEPLQLWWYYARQGKPFRVYRDGRVDTSIAAERGALSAGASTTVLTDAAKSWDAVPQQWKGRLLYKNPWYAAAEDKPMRWFIASNTATTVTVANAAVPEAQFDDAGTTYYIFDQPYDTYVLDVSQMRKFEPREHAQLDTYDIDIPLLRHEG